MSEIEEIVARVAHRTGLTPNLIRHGTGRGVQDARHAVFYAACQRGFSAKEVAEHLKLRPFSVVRGLRRVEKFLAALVSEAGR